jgi:hypothetical protein
MMSRAVSLICWLSPSLLVAGTALVWLDPECNASQPPNLRHPLRKLWEQAQRGVV